MSFLPAHEVIEGAAARPGATAFLLHGILGSRRNWASFARRLAQAHPAWRFVLVDLRNHGDSAGAPPPHGLAACAADLATLSGAIGRPRVVVGHSFGGKVALTYARDHGGGLREVWALDAAPGARTPEDDPLSHEVEQVVAACRALPTPVRDRAQVVEHFRGRGFSEMLANWMTTNVRREGDGLVWRFDLDAVEAMLADYWRTDLWPFLEAPPAHLRVHVLRAGRSDRWRPADVARLAALRGVDTHLLPDAGHWVHVDDPEGLLALLAGSFNAAGAGTA